jgi:hypothetical protein
MTILAILLTIVGVAASVASRDRSPLLVCGVTGMGAVMIGAMLVPGFSHLAGASATIALALVVSAGAVAAGARGRARRSNATAVTVVDLVFMSIAMLLVPAHATLPRFVTPIDAAADLGSHGPVAGGLMVWLTLAAWALSAVVLILPALRERAPEGSYHIVCSASMIAAMIAMAV